MRRLLLALFVLVAVTADASAAPFSYVTTSSGQFGTVDLSSGAFSQIGIQGPAPFTGIATGADGTIYGMDASNRLVTIDPTTGATAVVGPSGVGFAVFGGLASGGLYGLDINNKLYSVSVTTGAATLVGATGIPTLALHGYANSLAGNGSTLYYTEERGSPGALASTLFALDPATGTATTIGLTGIHDIVGSVFDNGGLYGFTSPFLSSSTIPSIWSLDTSTGAATFVHTLDPAAAPVFGGTPVPEPSSLLLLVSGFAFRRVRQSLVRAR
jgi:hypothetical protein